MDAWLALVSIEGEAMVRSRGGDLVLGRWTKFQGIEVRVYSFADCTFKVE